MRGFELKAKAEGRTKAGEESGKGGPRTDQKAHWFKVNLQQRKVPTTSHETLRSSRHV